MQVKLTGEAATQFQKGVSRRAGLVEIEDHTDTGIWIRGEPHSIEQFLARVYSKAKAVEDGVENGDVGDVGGESI